jgi:hypothetical protein
VGNMLDALFCRERGGIGAVNGRSMRACAARIWRVGFRRVMPAVASIPENA